MLARRNKIIEFKNSYNLGSMKGLQQSTRLVTRKMAGNKYRVCKISWAYSVQVIGYLQQEGPKNGRMPLIKKIIK